VIHRYRRFCEVYRMFSGKSVPKDQVALHYYYTSPSYWCTRYQNCKFHNFARTISRHADGISWYSVPPSAGPLLPLRMLHPTFGNSCFLIVTANFSACHSNCVRPWLNFFVPLMTPLDAAFSTLYSSLVTDVRAPAKTTLQWSAPDIYKHE